MGANGGDEKAVNVTGMGVEELLERRKGH
jgi:hypothetical protein